MKYRHAVPLISCLMIFGCALANGAMAMRSVTPVCKKGQASTPTKPCTKATIGTPAIAVAETQDTAVRLGKTDAFTVISILDPQRGLWQLNLSNTSGIGYINSFNWVPPVGVTIVAITSTEGGHCTLVNGDISCDGGGKGLAPPTCTCVTGGALTVNFLAQGLQPTFNGQYWTNYGFAGDYTAITAMTPVPYHIPSYNSGVGQDLPLCVTNQVSTPKNPCAQN
jgi:hypothetical protein